MKISNNFFLLQNKSAIKTTTKKRASYFVTKESPVIEDKVTDKKVWVLWYNKDNSRLIKIALYLSNFFNPIK